MSPDEKQGVAIPETTKILVSDLQRYGENPNSMSREELDGLKKNIQRYGFIIPIITNKDLLIADGHQRLTAAEELGMKEVPCIVLDIEKVDELIIRQVMNKLKGTHDKDLDAAEYKRIFEAGGQDRFREFMALSKNDYDDIKDIVVEAPAEQWRNPSKEEVEKIKTDIQVGQVYRLGNHRLMCGDATNPEHMKKLMNGRKAKLIFTSPPYNMAGDMYSEYSDDKKSQEYIDFNMSVLNNCMKHLNGFVFWNISYNRNARWEFLEIMHNFVKKTPLQFLELVVWNKKHALPIVSKDMLTRQYEDVLVLADDETVSKDLELFYLGTNKEKRAWFNKRTQKGLTNHWEIGTNKTQIEGHLDCYPVELPMKGILLCTIPDDVILEPFGGSGTNIIACEETGRVCDTMELIPVYCQITIDRWEKLTGQTAVLEE